MNAFSGEVVILDANVGLELRFDLIRSLSRVGVSNRCEMRRCFELDVTYVLTDNHVGRGKT